MGTIDLFLKFVLSAAASLRCAAGTLRLTADYLPFAHQAPCPNAGRGWLLRIGLFQLVRPKEQADDWIWIMDHTLQFGPYKCLIVIGIRVSAWDPRRPLCHEDMTLLNLTPMERSSGERVHEQLEAVARSTGIPRAVVSDEGTDLKRAMEFFRAAHPEVRHHCDLKHKCARVLKRELERDSRWGDFVKAANRTKLTTTQTELAYLTPPGLKTKARYMNLEPLVTWGTKALKFLDGAGAETVPAAERQRLREKLGWLRSYRPALMRWSELMQIIRMAEKAVQGGLHQKLEQELYAQVQPLATTRAARRLSKNILSFVQEQSAGMNAGERLIGSSEVLESVIGKYKRLQSQHSKGGMTAMLLSIGAMIGHTTTALIAQALEETRTADVTEWCRANLGQTVQSQRRLAFGATKTG